MPKLICIDDGHGMETAGKRTPVFPGTQNYMHENEFNRSVAGYLKTELERCGFTTLMVAPGDTDVPLKTRTDTAAHAKGDFYISIHANALTGVWGQQNGVSTYYYTNSKKGGTAAIFVHRQLIKGTPQKDRGILQANFHVLRELEGIMPSVLVECAFMDNQNEAKLLLSDSFRRECAGDICRGICDYFGVAYVKEETTSGFAEDIKFLSANDKVGINFSYWSQKAGIDKYFPDLIHKFAEYVKTKG